MKVDHYFDDMLDFNLLFRDTDYSYYVVSKYRFMLPPAKGEVIRFGETNIEYYLIDRADTMLQLEHYVGDYGIRMRKLVKYKS